MMKGNFLRGKGRGGARKRRNERKHRFEGAFTRRNAHTPLFARADTPPFPPFLRCMRAENDREKGEAEHTVARNERREKGDEGGKEGKGNCKGKRRRGAATVTR